MTGSEFYKYLMDYAYKNSAEVIQTCGGENGCTHPNKQCPSAPNAVCWKKCTNEIYQPDNNPNGRRKYDCSKLAHQYVYRQLDKQASEIFHALETFAKGGTSAYSSFNVLSLGCGPATELVGIDYFNEINSFNKQINYYGIDLEKTWSVILKKIRQYAEGDNYLNCLEGKCTDAITALGMDEFVGRKFNLIILNYVISSLVADGNSSVIDNLFENIADLIIRNQIVDCVIIINDMNRNDRGRNYFANLQKILENKGLRIFSCQKRSFGTSGDGIYGEGYANTRTVFENHCNIVAWQGNKCTSAQLLINAGINQ